MRCVSSKTNLAAFLFGLEVLGWVHGYGVCGCRDFHCSPTIYTIFIERLRLVAAVD